jgi:hypothetical protein
MALPMTAPDGSTEDSRRLSRLKHLSFVDWISFLGSFLNAIAIVIAVVALIYAVRQTDFAAKQTEIGLKQTDIALESLNLSLKGTQFQNALALIDQSFSVIEALKRQKNYIEVLKGTITTDSDVTPVEDVLELYQSQIFKASLLKDNNLMPPELWTLFVEDFCEMYNSYVFIKGWWGRQNVREPYSSRSLHYRQLSDACVSGTRG